MDSIQTVRHSNANTPRFATWTQVANSNVVQLRIRRPAAPGMPGNGSCHESALADEQALRRN